MRSVFVSNNDEVSIKVAHGYLKNGMLIADSTIENLKAGYTDEIDETSLVQNTVVFRRASFEDTVAIAGNISTAVDGSNVRFNPFAIRFQKMIRLLKSWDFKNEKGEPVPANTENLAKLDPAIANSIGIQLDLVGGSF